MNCLAVLTQSTERLPCCPHPISGRAQGDGAGNVAFRKRRSVPISGLSGGSEHVRRRRPCAWRACIWRATVNCAAAQFPVSALMQVDSAAEGSVACHIAPLPPIPSPPVKVRIPPPPLPGNPATHTRTPTLAPSSHPPTYTHSNPTPPTPTQYLGNASKSSTSMLYSFSFSTMYNLLLTTYSSSLCAA